MWTFSDFMAVLEDCFIGSEPLETSADFEEVNAEDDLLAEFNSVWEGR